MTTHLNKIRWGTIFLYGVLSEVLILGLAGLVDLLLGISTAAFAAFLNVGAFSLVLNFLFGYRAARKSGTLQVLHGFLVGMVSFLLLEGMVTLMVVILNVRQQGGPPPYTYAIVNALKILGGTSGGWGAHLTRQKGSRTLDLPSKEVV